MNSTVTDAQNLTKPGAQDLRVVKFTLYLLILCISVTGNTLVILSVVFFQRLKTVPNFFVANLAACDLVTTISSIPFDLPSEDLGYWPYGGFMCKILWPLATFSATSSVFTLLSISADRYGALLHPLNFRYKITKRKCVFVMCFVYTLAALAVLPYLIFLKYFAAENSSAMPQCGEEWPDFEYRKAYTVFLFSIQYGIPLVIMTYIYVRLGCLLRQNTRQASDMSSEKKPLSPMRKTSQISNASSASSVVQSSLQRRKEKNDKTVKMFFVVVLIFLLFMLPNQILWLLYDFGNSKELVDHIDLVAFVCRVFTYTNSVLNAMVYGACNANFRRAFKAILRCKCGKRHQREVKRSLSINRGRAISEITYNKSRSPKYNPAKRQVIKKDHSATETDNSPSNSDDSPPPLPGRTKSALSQTAGFSSTKKKGIHWDGNVICNCDINVVYEKSENTNQAVEESLDSKKCCNENMSWENTKDSNTNNKVQVYTFESTKETTI